MHQAQQALDDRRPGLGDRGADRRENRGPAQTDQRIGHGGEAGRQPFTKGGRDPGVVGDPLRVPVHRHGGRSAGHLGQELRPVHAGGNRQDRTHRGGGVFGGDHRSTAVNGVGVQREWDVDPDPGHRDTENDLFVAGLTVGLDLQPSSGG